MSRQFKLEMEQSTFNVYEEVDEVTGMVIQKGVEEETVFSLNVIQKWEGLDKTEVEHLPDVFSYVNARADNYL